MTLKRAECLLLNTEQGQIGWVCSIWFSVVLGLVLCAALQVEAFRSSSQYMEDALAFSNLAAIVVDIEEYGSTHQILIDDPQKAWERYRYALKKNLNLDDQFHCSNQNLITGPVMIESFIVYCVQADKIDIYQWDASGGMSHREAAPGSVVSPNGKEVTASGVYSEISYSLEGILGLTTHAQKGNLADVTSNH